MQKNVQILLSCVINVILHLALPDYVRAELIKLNFVRRTAVRLWQRLYPKSIVQTSFIFWLLRHAGRMPGPSNFEKKKNVFAYIC